MGHYTVSDLVEELLASEAAASDGASRATSSEVACKVANFDNVSDVLERDHWSVPEWILIQKAVRQLA